MTSSAPVAHDLFLLADRTALTAPDGAALDPSATVAAAATVSGAAGAWVVVRRATVRSGWIPVGIRGPKRSDRFAAEVPADTLLRAVSPADVPRTPVPQRASLPAFRALRAFGRIAAAVFPGLAWGPVGSVGYELVTGRPAVTATSDLDVVLIADEPLHRPDVHRGIEAAAWLAARVDLQVRTPGGGFALAEWAREPGGVPIVLRTDRGPLLTTNPWSVL
ncbi:malonate decarboxylase holo-ACP synthase [Micromonospora sp. NPDC047707]|uniref:malonate decarboxylase holo-ACP synthase n=1 Tax=Micromonospora sp. NPDC047707 TaxID=3154498 RepID=UPI003453E866